MKLEEGDVILLNQRKDEPIHVYVGEQAKFKAAPGKAGNHRALRVMKVLNTDTPTKEDERVQA
jgi:flagellar motor switch protein FliM